MIFDTGLSYMVSYIVTTVFVFFGVYVGALLAFIAPEELAPGKLYFKALMNTLLVFIILILLHAYNANLFVLIFLGVVMSITLYYTHLTSPINQIAYFLLGIAFFFSTKSVELFITITSMIFIYGLPLGSLYVARRMKKSKKTLLADVFLNFSFFMVVSLMTNLIVLYIGNI
ncbi:MAG: hypothetical protein V1729_01975 [Candidatus Woesearchaeota archaeon]